MSKYTTRDERYEPVEINGVKYSIKAELKPVESWETIEEDYGSFVSERNTRGVWYIDRRTGVLHDPSGEAVYQSGKGRFVDSHSLECVIPALTRYSKKDLEDPRNYFKGVEDKDWLRKQFRKHGSWANILYAEIIEDWDRLECINDGWISVLDMVIEIFVNGRRVAVSFGGPFEFESRKDWEGIEAYVPEAIDSAWYDACEYLKSIGAGAPDEDYPPIFEQYVIDQLH